MSSIIEPQRTSSPLSASVISTASTALRHPPSALGYRFSTLCTTVDNPDADHKDRHGSSSVPIYQTATFKGMGGAYDYSRSGNPSRTFLGKTTTTTPAFVSGILVLIFDLVLDQQSITSPRSPQPSMPLLSPRAWVHLISYSEP